MLLSGSLWNALNYFHQNHFKIEQGFILNERECLIKKKKKLFEREYNIWTHSNFIFLLLYWKQKKITISKLKWAFTCINTLNINMDKSHSVAEMPFVKIIIIQQPIWLRYPFWLVRTRIRAEWQTGTHLWSQMPEDLWKCALTNMRNPQDYWSMQSYAQFKLLLD